MQDDQVGNPPVVCPSCGDPLAITHLHCSACGTEVTGNFALGGLVGLPEPHASLIELFLRVRGNMKEMERELGLSYPTVRARLDEALTAAGFDRLQLRGDEERELTEARSTVLDELEGGTITAAEAASRLRALSSRRT